MPLLRSSWRYLTYISAQTIVYCLIVYAMIGFEWTATKFFWYTFFQFACLLYLTFYGMMIVAITPNANSAAIVAALFMYVCCKDNVFIKCIELSTCVPSSIYKIVYII